MIIFYWTILVMALIFISNDIYYSIFKPEDKVRIEEDVQRRMAENKRIKQPTYDEDGNIICPVCSSKQIQLMKRGWKFTTGFLGSSKVERVCMSCKHKF